MTEINPKFVARQQKIAELHRQKLERDLAAIRAAKPQRRNKEMEKPIETLQTYIAKIRKEEKMRYAKDYLAHRMDPFATKFDETNYSLSYMARQAVRIRIAELTAR